MPCPKNRYGLSTLGTFGRLMSFITVGFTLCTIPQNQIKVPACVWQLPHPNSRAGPSLIRGSRLNAVQVFPTLTPLHSMTPKVERITSIGVQTQIPSVFRNSPQIG